MENQKSFLWRSVEEMNNTSNNYIGNLGLLSIIGLFNLFSIFLNIPLWEKILCYFIFLFIVMILYALAVHKVWEKDIDELKKNKKELEDELQPFRNLKDSQNINKSNWLNLVIERINFCPNPNNSEKNILVQFWIDSFLVEDYLHSEIKFWLQLENCISVQSFKPEEPLLLHKLYRSNLMEKTVSLVAEDKLWEIVKQAREEKKEIKRGLKIEIKLSPEHTFSIPFETKFLTKTFGE